MIRHGLLLALLLPICALCQQQGTWTLGTRAGAGFLAPHHKGLWIMVDRHASAGELFLQRNYSGARTWHGNYLRPSWGLSALWLDAGADRLGPALRLLPYLELPLVEPGRWTFSTRIGWGVGLVRDPFDRVENFKQHAIGGRLNLAAQWALALRRSFGRHSMDLGFAMDHLSNAAMQQPNLGINVPSLSLGYAYRMGSEGPRTLRPDSTWRQEPRTRVLAMANVGWSEVYPLESGRRSVLSLSASMYRRATPKSAFGIGADLFNKGTVAVMDTALAGRGRASLSQFGVHAGYALLMGDMALYYELGTYLITPVEERAAVYTRVGLRQHLTPRLFANFTLKSHLFVADHFEVGIGYRFR